MESRFIVPVYVMLVALGLWLIYFTARAFSAAVKGWSTQAEVAIALVAGGLIVFSGFA